jgi:hypothetical protein
MDIRHFIRLIEDAAQHPMTETPAFKAWFAGSKVVDRNGEPLRCFHSTDADFDTFHPASHFGTARAAKNRAAERRKPGARTIPVYLSIKNPLRIFQLSDGDDEASLLNGIIRGRIDVPGFDIGLARREGAHAALKAIGYDGLVYENDYDDDGADSWIIFDPSQVKSAITNTGKFSSENPSITEAR